MAPSPGEALVARRFTRGQRRAKGFGGMALGAGATDTIARIFAGHGYHVLRGASPWIIPRQAREMALDIAMGHAEAALRHERRGAAQINAWAETRMGQADAGLLSARVGHQDILCLPGQRIVGFGRKAREKVSFAAPRPLRWHRERTPHGWNETRPWL